MLKELIEQLKFIDSRIKSIKEKVKENPSTQLFDDLSIYDESRKKLKENINNVLSLGVNEDVLKAIERRLNYALTHAMNNDMAKVFLNNIFDDTLNINPIFKHVIVLLKDEIDLVHDGYCTLKKESELLISDWQVFAEYDLVEPDNREGSDIGKAYITDLCIINHDGKRFDVESNICKMVDYFVNV